MFVRMARKLAKLALYCEWLISIDRARKGKERFADCFLFTLRSSSREEKILSIDKGGGKLGRGRLSSCHEIPSRVGRHPSVTTFQRRTPVGRKA